MAFLAYSNLIIMKQVLTCYFALLTIPVFSQIQTDSINSKSIKIRLQDDTTNAAFSINLSRLTILDARDDTSDLGYFVSTIGGVKKYVFKSGFTEELTEWYSRYLMANEQNKTNTSLFVNIKKLRLSNQITPQLRHDGQTGQPHDGWEKGIIAKIEYFIEKDSFYIPLYRFDSIIILQENLRRNADEYVSTALKASLVKLFTINLDHALLSKNKILFKDIIRSNTQAHNFPVYTSSLSKKGVYKTFNEFKMNEPSLTDFEFRKGKMGDILYVKEDGNEYPARKVWGFCDGENFFINSGDKYSKLVRSGYSFYFEGIKAITRKSSSSNINLPIYDPITGGYFSSNSPQETKFKKEIRYYQVDMETGEVY